ncbi:hypothetical protein EV368DRAFT_90161 [Lentinula lateritia]|nr:hypothetical protein EV368DRAFT_90161 [Lentinula lateritia]
MGSHSLLKESSSRFDGVQNTFEGHPMNLAIRRDVYDPSLLPDLTGKVALVTGSNSPLGIGWNVANQLALHGAKVYVHARTLNKAQVGITAILASSQGRISVEQLEPFVVELSNLRAVRDVAAAFVAKESRLDILVNNAGVLACGLKLDDHGISTSMTPFRSICSHPGTAPAVKENRSGPPWCTDNHGTLLASGSYQYGSINFVGPENLSRLDDAQTPLQGALAPLFVAAAEEVWEERSKWAAAYVMPYGVPSPVDESEAAKDSKLAKELWETTENVLTENVGISVKF